MDFLFVYIVFAILGVVGTILFWGAIAALIYKLFKSGGGAAGGGGGPFVGPDAALLQQLQQIEMLVRQAQAAQRQGRGPASQGQGLPPELQMRFQTDLLRMQNEMRQLDGLSRQRHETFVSGMLSDASAAGLDVSSWNTSNW